MLISILASFLSLAAIAQDAKPDPRESLETAIPEAIRLLEAKEAVTFIKQFAHPDDLKKLAEQGKTPENMAEQFSGDKSMRLLAVLKEIKDKKPEASEDGLTMLYKVEDNKAPGGKIVFQKSGKLWYIRN